MLQEKKPGDNFVIAHENWTGLFGKLSDLILVLVPGLLINCQIHTSESMSSTLMWIAVWRICRKGRKVKHVQVILSLKVLNKG